MPSKRSFTTQNLVLFFREQRSVRQEDYELSNIKLPGYYTPDFKKVNTRRQGRCVIFAEIPSPRLLSIPSLRQGNSI